MNSPCLTCTRVKDPKNCENKTCKDWQAWFIDRWESMRENLRAQMEEAKLEEQGVPLGGHRYAPPHQLRHYLETDPCQDCNYPKDQCSSPCPLRKIWEQHRKEVCQ